MVHKLKICLIDFKLENIIFGIYLNFKPSNSAQFEEAFNSEVAELNEKYDNIIEDGCLPLSHNFELDIVFADKVPDAPVKTDITTSTQVYVEESDNDEISSIVTDCVQPSTISTVQDPPDISGISIRPTETPSQVSTTSTVRSE